MPISYIDIFRPPQQDGVSQILSGAQNVLTGALNSAIQIGRDHVNLQASQERDYLAEQERNQLMNQRRVEFWQGQKNIDRNFVESVFRYDKDTAEANADDERDYKFKVRTDIRDAGVRKMDVDSLLGSRAATTDLAQKKFELDKQESDLKKETLRKRNDDILDQHEPKNWIQKLFSGPEKTVAPEVQISQAAELKKNALELGDLKSAAKADAIMSDAVVKKGEQRIKTILSARAAYRKPAKTEADKLEEVQDNIAALNDPRIVEDSDLSQARLIELVKLEKERERLLRKLGVDRSMGTDEKAGAPTGLFDKYRPK